MHSVFLYKSKLYYQRLSPLTDLKNFIRGLKILGKFLFSGKLNSFVKGIYSTTNPIHKNILAFHMFLIVFNWKFFLEYRFMYLWMIAGIILFLFTKIPNFRFLGKPERYLEFVICPATILLVIFISQNPIINYLILPYFLFNLIGIYFYNKEFIELYRVENSEFKVIQNGFRHFNENQEEGITWTMHPFIYKLMFFSVFPILGYFAGTINKKLSSQEELDDMMGNYPYPSYDLSNIIDKYSIEYIIITKTYLHAYFKKAGIDEGNFVGKKMEKVAEVKDIIFLKRIKTS